MIHFSMILFVNMTYFQSRFLNLRNLFKKKCLFQSPYVHNALLYDLTAEVCESMNYYGFHGDPYHHTVISVYILSETQTWGLFQL